MGNCINDEGMICIFWGSKRYFFLSKGRCCLMSSTIVAALLVESFNSDELKFNLFPLRFLLFFWGGVHLFNICWTAEHFQNVNCWNKIVWSHWETAKLWCFEAEVWTLTVFRSEFLHPHHAQHPSEACLAKLLVWFIEDWICLTAIFLPFVSIFSMYAAYMFVQWFFLLRINPCFKKTMVGWKTTPMCLPRIFGQHQGVVRFATSQSFTSEFVGINFFRQVVTAGWQWKSIGTFILMQ